MTEQKPQARLVTVAAGVHAWIGAAGDSNAGAIETPEGVIVIDAQQYPRLARELRAAVQARTAQPLRILVDTHCHLDHTHGNTVFADVPILAHANTLAAMNACLGSRAGPEWSITDFAAKLRLLFGQNILELVPAHDPARRWFEGRIAAADYDTVMIRPPNETFAGDFAFHLPDDTVRLHYFGPAHCDGDIVVHLEKRKVAFLGDLLFHNRFPWLGDCDLDGLIAALGRVLALDLAVVIPGHGPPATLADVACFRDMLVELRAAVAHAIKAGHSEDAAVAEVALPQFAHVTRYAEWLPIDVRAAYRYLRAG
ncbi:MAG TPA: MBL fold metallo-hydrolase [Xanthobacteraceae bacterium]|jgi:glyoxylase-like metal-dependent hydrolase (beta-lactamase superfamily II)|nr:MBL fold metallo-hydrolase [Xanthobacteraceae bacterium]